MKKLLLLLTGIFFAAQLNAQQFKWAGMLTGTYGVQINAYTNDASGNSYVYAYMPGEDTSVVDVDPSPAVHNLVVGDGWNFVAKYDATGALVWVRQIGGESRMYNVIMKIDPSNNNLVMFGNNYNTNYTDLDLGPGVYNIANNYGGDLVIARYNPADCAFLGVKRIISSTNFQGDNLVSVVSFDAGTFWFPRSTPIDIDAQGNITIAGSFTGRANFEINNPVPSSTWNIDAGSSSQPFVVKYNAAGNILWKNMTYNGWGNVLAVKSDNAGNVYALGRSSNVIWGTTITSSMFNNAIFIQKFASTGTPVWTREIAMPSVLVTNQGAVNSYANNLIIDQADNLFITGYFSGIIDFDPGAGTQSLVAPTGDFNGFMAKYNNNGEYVWAKDLDYTGVDYLRTNAANKIVATVYTADGDIDFGTNVTDTAGYFLGIYDTAANLYSYQRFDTNIYVAGLETGGTDDVFTWGYFDEQADFDLSTPLGILTPMPPDPMTGYGLPQASFINRGNSCKPNNTVLTDSICQGTSYTFNSQSLTDAGVYAYTLPASATCDSVIILDLSTYTITGSVNASVCQGTSYAFAGQQYDTAGMYNHTFSTAGGCDSVVTLHLTVNSVNVGVTQSGNALTANATGATYQWMNCANNTIIQGATANTFTPSVSGSYKVIITKNGCSDTSICYNVNITGIDQPEFAKNINIFPNPAQDKLCVSYTPGLALQTMTITDMAGRVLQTLNTTDRSGKVIADVQQLRSGVYLLKLRCGNEKATFKFVKK